MNKSKDALLENKTVVVIGSIESLSTDLGQVMQEYGASVHISNVDMTEDADKEMTVEEKEDFVLIYIR